MKIKDVEQQVGISAHSIRYYEEMGLIQINRMKDSTYRDFSEADVKKLKEIKLFRDLGITLEEIRRFYAKEITLSQLMDHQKQELKLQHEDMVMKQKLCEDIKQGNVPLVPYVVNKYNDVIHHVIDKLPYEQAGSLLSQWGEVQFSKKRIMGTMLILMPMFWIIVTNTLWYILLLPEMMGFKAIQHQTMISMLLAIPITLLLGYIYYLYVFRNPGELYEFCEKGIYYINKDTVCNLNDVHKALKSGHVQNSYDFVSYDNINVFKVWYRSVGKTPVNGEHIYQVDFRIFTDSDEMILLNTGIVGTSDEKVKITSEILKQYAKKTVDPFHILNHLDDDRVQFYKFIDNVHREREHKRVGLTK